MASVHQVHTQCSLSVEVTFYRTVDGYWGFAHHFPVHAHGETLDDCTATLCASLQTLLTAGLRTVNRAVCDTVDGTIMVENPYTTPVCAVELFDPTWPQQRRQPWSLQYRTAVR